MYSPPGVAEPTPRISEILQMRQHLLVCVLQKRGRFPSGHSLEIRPLTLRVMGNTHDTEIARIEADYIHTKWRTTDDYRWGYSNDRGNTTLSLLLDRL
jgi:hypothetical protein